MAPSRNKNNSDKNKMAPASSSITESDSAAAVAEAPTLRPRRAIIVYNERQLQARANEERRLSKGGGSAISSSSCILPTDLSSESANEVEGRTPRKRCSSTSEDSAKNSKRLRPKLGQNEEELKEKVDNKFSLPRRSTRSTTSACMLQSEKQKQKAAKTDDKADDKAFAKLSTIATSSISTSTFSIAQLTRSNKSSKNETCDTTSTSLTSSVSVKNATSSASCNNKKSSTDATETTVSRNGAPSIYDTTVESVIETLRKESRSPSSSVISSNAASSRNTPQPSLSSSYNVPPSTTVAEALLYQSGGGSHSIFSGSSSAGKTNSQLIQSILQSAAASAALAIGDESIIPSSSAINATFSSVLNSMRNSRLRREMEAPIRYAMGGGGRRTKGPVTSLYTASIPAVNVTDAELFRPSWSMPDLAVVSRVTADIMQLGRAIFHDSSWARIKFPERSLFGQEAIVYHYRSVRWTDRHMMFVPYGKPRINEDIPYTCSDCFKFMQCLKHRFTEAQQRNKIPVLIVRYGRFLDDPDYPAVKHICDPDELTDMEKEALREYGESLRACSTEFHNQQQSSASASSPLTAEQNEEKSEKEYRRLLLMLEAQLTACCAKMINAGLDFTSDTLRRKSGELSEDLGIPASRISDEWLTMIGRRLGVSTSFASDYLRDDRFASSAMDIAADEVEEEVDNKAWNANDYLLNIISAAMDSSSGGGAAVDNDNLTTTPDGGVKTELTDTTSMCVEEEVPQLLKATTNEETARTFSGNNSDDTSMLPAEGHCSPSTSDAAVVSGSMESVSVLVSESALPIQLFTSTPPIVEDGVIASGSGEEFLQRMEASLSSGVESSLQREIKREVLDEEFVVSRANPSVDSIGGNNDCASSNVVDHSTLNQPSTSNEASTTTDASTMSHSASTNITNNSSVNISSPATMRSVYDLIVSAAAAASRANKLAMKRKKMANGVVVGGRRKSLTLSSPSSPSVLTKPTGSTTNDVDKCKSLSPLTVVCDTTACASQPSSCRSSPALTLANGAVGKRNGVAGKVANGTVQSSNGGVSASVMALLMNGGYEDGCCTEQPQNGMTVGAANTTLTAEKNNNNTKNTLFSMLQANFTNFNHPEVAIALETIRRHIETRDHSLMPMFNTFSARITKMMYTTLPKAAHNGVRGDDGMKSGGGEGNALTA